MVASPVHARILAIAGLLVLTSLAGCAGKEGNTDPAPAQTKQDPPTTDSPVPSEIANATGLVRNITVNVDFTTPGLHASGGGIDPPTCTPAPPNCRFGVHERIDFADASSFNGSIHDTAWFYPDSVDERTVAGTMLFTGSITGCTGSGTLTMPWRGEGDEDPIEPDPNGMIHEHDYVTTFTNSTGFARIIEVNLDFDAYLSPVGASGYGHATGYILCE